MLYFYRMHSTLTITASSKFKMLVLRISKIGKSFGFHFPTKEEFHSSILYKQQIANVNLARMQSSHKPDYTGADFCFVSMCTVGFSFPSTPTSSLPSSL